MQRIILAGTLLLALSSPAMAGKIYKWIDAQGTTHYGEQPPEGRPATSINPVVAPPRPAAAPAPESPESPAENVMDDEQKAIDEKVKADVAAQSAKIAENCTIFRTNLAQMENNPRVRIEVDGEIRRLGEDERQAKIAEAKKLISENCQ